MIRSGWEQMDGRSRQKEAAGSGDGTGKRWALVIGLTGSAPLTDPRQVHPVYVLRRGKNNAG